MTSKTKRGLFWSVAVLALLVALLIAVLLSAPTFVQSKMFKERVVALVADRIDGQLDYTDLRLKLFPFPVVDIRDLALSIPDGISARTESLLVAIRILPLFKGQLQLREFRLESPWVAFNLAVSPAAGSGDETVSTDESVSTGTPVSSELTLTEQIAQVIGFLKQTAGDASVKIRNGRIHLMDGDTVFDIWQDVSLTYAASPAVITVDLTTVSTTFGQLGADLLIEPISLDIDGRINLSETNLPQLAAQYLPPGPIAIKAGQLRLGIRFSAQRLSSLDANLIAAIPALHLQRSGQRLILEGLNLEAAIQRRPDSVKIDLTTLSLAHPALEISGAARRPSDADWSVELAARPIDIGSLRAPALYWAGDLAAVATVFDILRGGQVQRLAARASAPTLAGLASLAHIDASAVVEKVAVRVPKTDLDVADISGRIDLDQGVLSARIDHAGLIGTRLADGYYRMDLLATPLALQAEIGIQADLGMLPDILRKVLDAEMRNTVAAEMEAISGRVDGRFEIDGPLADLRWRVLVNELTGQVKSPRLPFPATVTAASGRYADASLTIDRLSGSLGTSLVDGLSGRIVLGEAPMIQEASGRLNLALGELFAWARSMEAAREALEPFLKLDGRAIVSDLRFTGPLSDPLSGDYRLRGRLQEIDIRLAGDRLPDDLALFAEGFQVSPGGIRFNDLAATVSDISLSASGRLSDPFSADRSLRLSASGSIGPQAARWALEKWGGADWVALEEPLNLAQLSLSSDLKGSHSFSGELQPAEGQKITAELQIGPDKISAPAITVRDAYSDARIRFEKQTERSTARFNGRLDLRSFAPFLAAQLPDAGWVAGDMRLMLTGSDWRDTRMTGQLEGGDIKIPLPESGKDAPILDRFAIAATGNQLVIRSADLEWDETALRLAGWLDRAETGIQFDLQATSPYIDVDALLAKFHREEATAAQTDAPTPPSEADPRPTLDGVLRLDVDHLNYEGYEIRPLAAKISVHGDNILVEVPQADLCDVSLAGSLEVDPHGIKLVFQPTSATRKVGEALSCLLQKPIEADGHLYLVGDIRAEGTPVELLKTLGGQVVMAATDGRIYRAHLLAKILALVNVTEIFAGQYPGFTGEGMAYKRLELGGAFEKGIFTFDTCSLDSPSLQMTCRGEVDAAQKEMNLTFLAAPLKTVDRVVKKLPVIGYVLGGTLISIPIKVHGPLDDPAVVPLSPTAVGKGTLDILKRTLQVPVKVLQPVTGALE